MTSLCIKGYPGILKDLLCMSKGFLVGGRSAPPLIIIIIIMIISIIIIIISSSSINVVIIIVSIIVSLHSERGSSRVSAAPICMEDAQNLK